MIRRSERGSNWTDPEIVELLQLWSDELVQMELESSPRNQRVFDRISQILSEKGIYRTGDQCREKIKKMKLEYRRIKDNHKMRPWKFYDVLDRVLSNRPSVSYSTLAGAVIAQQVFQSPGEGECPAQGSSAGSFGPASVGGFLFGHPPKSEDQFEIKCEDIEESMVNSGVDPSEMYYGSGDELRMETEGHSDEPEEYEDTVPTSDVIDSSGSLSSSKLQHNTPKADHGGSVRERKRPHASKVKRSLAGVCCGSQGRLDKALVRFMHWQQLAESRLLALEEARLERELQAEERREQREDLRAERDRQHELRLFSMLAGALSTVKPGPPTQTDTSLSSLAHPSDSLGATVSPSLSQSPSQATQTVFNLEPAKSTAPLSAKPKEVPGPSVYLSSRGNTIRQYRCILQEGYDLYEKDAYHSSDNPQGVIKMCTSENKLCGDILLKRLTQPDMLHFDPSVMQYGDSKGQAYLREEVAKFLTDYACSPEPLSADNVVVMNGCTSVFSCLAAVICDPKDGFLIPTPFYNYIADDVSLYSHVKLFHVPLDCEVDGEDNKPFRLTVDRLEEGLKKAKKEGVVIRGVILMNPHNPLAEVYTLEEMNGFLEFAKRNELHAIVDEIYMLSIFDECVPFHSVLSRERLPDPQRTHILWGLSKDFALSGIRIGALYSKNRDLVDAVAKLGVFHSISGATQRQMARLLHDRVWINEEFLPENRRRLKAAHRYLTGELQSLGIPYMNRPATLYIWADLRKYLAKPTFEEELSVWRGFLRHKVVLTCGQVFSCSTPGWFRIVFADSMSILEQGVKRMREALKEIEATNSMWNTNSAKHTSKLSNKSLKEDSAESDNAVTENSTSSPCSKPSDLPTENNNSASSPDLPVSDELVLLECRQEVKPSDSLESLIGTLKNQISSSDWLEKNTPVLSAGENPEVLDVFTALLQRARK
ncbi:1-aminocyclopropane-1-carboxylate synthase-like protein 1 [Synchiropus picturatus]